MESSAAEAPQDAPIVACTISRDAGHFEHLAAELEREIGPGWGRLSFAEAPEFLARPEAAQVEFTTIALDAQDADDLERVRDLIGAAREHGIGVFLVAEEVSALTLHQLLRLGADDFLPYPLPEGVLREAVERLRTPAPPPPTPPAPVAEVPQTGGGGPARHRDGTVLPVHGLAGGVGATTFAVNLAYELAVPQKRKTPAPRVCLMDFDFQFGGVATYLDLPRREAVYDLLADIARMDADAFTDVLLGVEDRVQVLTAPADILPLDIVGPDEIAALIDTARAEFDYVVVDMPSTVVQWTETVLDRAHVYLALLQLDLRSAQNALRLIRALKAEDLAVEKLRLGVNRAPGFADRTGKSRLRRMAEGLDMGLELQLPDGGRQVAEACDHGTPLGRTAPRNALRKEIRKLAMSLAEQRAATRAAG